jgi:hypothetical protein
MLAGTRREERPRMTTVDIDHLLRNDELQQLLDAAEQAGSLKATELAEIVETHELDALEQDALYRELDRRGIELARSRNPRSRRPPRPRPHRRRRRPTRCSSSSAKPVGMRC